MPVVWSSCQKHLVYFLMKNWTLLIILKKNFKSKEKPGYPKEIGQSLLINSLITIYKSLIWPHIDFGAIILINQTIKVFVKIESVQLH